MLAFLETWLRIGIRNQESGIRNQESEIRNQKSGIRNQKSEIRNQESGIRNQKSGIIKFCILGSIETISILSWQWINCMPLSFVYKQYVLQCLRINAEIVKREGINNLNHQGHFFNLGSSFFPNLCFFSVKNLTIPFAKSRKL